MQNDAYNSRPTDFGGGTSSITRNMTNEQKEELRSLRNRGLRKIRIHGLVGMLLSVLAIGTGIAVLIIASKNIAFPTFNFGPVIVGLVFLFGGLMGWQASRKGLNDEASQDMPSGKVKCYVVGHFVICVTCISLALVAAVFSLIAAGVCFDPDEVISRNKQGKEVNLSKACEPNKSGNAIAGLLAGLVCIFIAIWAIFGTCFLCCYGRSFGFTNRRQQQRQIRMLEQRVAQMEMQGNAPPPYTTGQHNYNQYGGAAHNKQ